MGYQVGPAAFRRLCVETFWQNLEKPIETPAAFRRLCVETADSCPPLSILAQPPSGGCVLKQDIESR